MPHPGSSGGDAVSGVTGKGEAQADANAKSPSAPPGAGLNGGLGASSGTAAMGAGKQQDQVPQGSSNTTPRSSVGNR